MDVIFEAIHLMFPSSLSEDERRLYQAEKMMLRQFMLLEQQGEVPPHLSVVDMKTLLLNGRNLHDEFEVDASGDLELMLTAEQAWTAARHACVNQMEAELLEELDREWQLSQLMRTNVTLEGLRMFAATVRPGADEDVRACLPHLHRALFNLHASVRKPNRMIRVGAVLSKLEKCTAPVVPALVDTALRILLEEPGQGDGREDATVELSVLLFQSVAPCFPPSISQDDLLGACIKSSCLMVTAVCARLAQRIGSFHLLGHDESVFAARESVLAVMEDMDPHSRAPSFDDQSVVTEESVDASSLSFTTGSGISIALQSPDDLHLHGA